MATIQDVPAPGPAKEAAAPSAESTSSYSQWIRAFTNTGLPCPETAEAFFKHSREKQAAPFMNPGFKFALAAALGPTMTHIHTFQLGSVKEQKYNVQAFLANDIDKEKGQGILLSGDLDTDWNLQGTLTYNHTKNTKIQAQGGLTHATFLSYDMEHKGADYNIAARLIPNLSKGQYQTTASYVQSVTEKLAVGIEGAYDVFSDPPPHTWRDLNLSWMAMYKGSDWTASGRLDVGGGLQMAYSRRISPKAAMSTEVVMDARLNSQWNVAYQFDLRFGKVKGQIDSSGTMHAILEKPLPFGTFMLCGTQQGFQQPTQKFGGALLIG